MQVFIEISKLNELLDIASRFVSKNSTLPILQNIYLKSSIDNLIIRATDMEKFIEIETSCDVRSEGSITISSKTLLEIIKTTDTKEVELIVDHKTNILTIKTPKDVFNINGISANEYIASPETPQTDKIQIETSVFSEGIQKVEYAVTDKNFSPVLTGIYLRTIQEGDNKYLIFAGTDSFRLAEYKINIDNNIQDFALIIPKTSIIDIQKISEFAQEKGCENIQMQYSENIVAFECMIEGTRIMATSLLLQGNFPEYNREDIMPTSFNQTIILDKHLCEKAIKKIGILTRDINNFIQIQTKENSIEISSGKTDKGLGTTNTSAIISGEEISFGINGKFITDFIKTIKGDEIKFNIVNNQKPIILTDKMDSNYKYVVRPLIN